MKKTVYECDCCHRQVEEKNITHLKARSKSFVNYSNYDVLFSDRKNFDICSDCLEHIGLASRRIVDRDGRKIEDEDAMNFRRWQETSALAELDKRICHADEFLQKFSEDTIDCQVYDSEGKCRDVKIKVGANGNSIGTIKKHIYSPWNSNRIVHPHRIDESSIKLHYGSKGEPVIYYTTLNGVQYMHKLPDEHNYFKT